MFSKGFSLELGLLFLGLEFQFLLDFFLARFFVDAERPTDVSLIIIIELIHGVWVILNDLDVSIIIVPVGPLNAIENVKAILQLFVELHMVDGVSHLVNFDLKLVFLTGGDVVVMISTLS